MEFGEDGVGSIEMTRDGRAVVYDLNGNRVTRAKGNVYVVNGKKVIFSNGICDK